MDSVSSLLAALNAHSEDNKKPIEAEEFRVTRIAGLSATALIPAIAVALPALYSHLVDAKMDPAVIQTSFWITGLLLLGALFVGAVDVLARAWVTAAMRGRRDQPPPGSSGLVSESAKPAAPVAPSEGRLAVAVEAIQRDLVKLSTTAARDRANWANEFAELNKQVLALRIPNGVVHTAEASQQNPG
ncbi:MAG TPA: hypothetical protein VGL99_16130 [Chloroflexota bacterium]|jgi:hypothetical protein